MTLPPAETLQADDTPLDFASYARTLLAFLAGLIIGGSVVATAGGLW